MQRHDVQVRVGFTCGGNNRRKFFLGTHRHCPHPRELHAHNKLANRSASLVRLTAVRQANNHRAVDHLITGEGQHRGKLLQIRRRSRVCQVHAQKGLNRAGRRRIVISSFGQRGNHAVTQFAAPSIARYNVNLLLAIVADIANPKRTILTGRLHSGNHIIRRTDERGTHFDDDVATLQASGRGHTFGVNSSDVRTADILTQVKARHAQKFGILDFRHAHTNGVAHGGFVCQNAVQRTLNVGRRDSKAQADIQTRTGHDERVHAGNHIAAIPFDYQRTTGVTGVHSSVGLVHAITGRVTRILAVRVRHDAFGHGETQTQRTTQSNRGFATLGVTSKQRQGTCRAELVTVKADEGNVLVVVASDEVGTHAAHRTIIAGHPDENGITGNVAVGCDNHTVIFHSHNIAGAGPVTVVSVVIHGAARLNVNGRVEGLFEGGTHIGVDLCTGRGGDECRHNNQRQSGHKGFDVGHITLLGLRKRSRYRKIEVEKN